jgi:hypothetical protein
MLLNSTHNSISPILRPYNPTTNNSTVTINNITTLPSSPFHSRGSTTKSIIVPITQSSTWNNLLSSCKINNTLSLRGNVNDSDIETLLDTLQSFPCDDLQQLMLASNYITHIGCTLLCTSSSLLFNNLIELDLSDNQITDEAMIHFPELTRSSHRLRILKLSGNQIGDEGITYLSHAVMSTLDEFNITYNNFGDQGILAIAQELLTANHVQRLHVTTGNLSKITPSTLRVLTFSWAQSSSPLHYHDIDTSLSTTDFIEERIVPSRNPSSWSSRLQVYNCSWLFQLWIQCWNESYYEEGNNEVLFDIPRWILLYATTTTATNNSTEMISIQTKRYYNALRRIFILMSSYSDYNNPGRSSNQNQNEMSLKNRLCNINSNTIRRLQLISRFCTNQLLVRRTIMFL